MLTAMEYRSYQYRYQHIYHFRCYNYYYTRFGYHYNYNSYVTITAIIIIIIITVIVVLGLLLVCLVPVTNLQALILLFQKVLDNFPGYKNYHSICFCMCVSIILPNCLTASMICMTESLTEKRPFIDTAILAISEDKSL
jgi:hypothetical protein